MSKKLWKKLLTFIINTSYASFIGGGMTCQSTRSKLRAFALTCHPLWLWTYFKSLTTLPPVSRKVELTLSWIIEKRNYSRNRMWKIRWTSTGRTPKNSRKSGRKSRKMQPKNRSKWRYKRTKTTSFGAQRAEAILGKFMYFEARNSYLRQIMMPHSCEWKMIMWRMVS